MMDLPFGNMLFGNPLASSSQSRQSTTRPFDFAQGLRQQSQRQQ